MKRLLKLGDIFSFEFKFSSFGSSRFGTIIGGLFSLFLLVIGIVVLSLFGQDFYQRTNPFVTTQKEVPDSYSFINVTSDNFTVAFRFETYEGKLFEHEGFLIVGYYYRSTELKANLVIENCDSLNIINPLYNKELKGDKGWKCVNFNNTIADSPITQIGSTSNLEVFYFYIDFMIGTQDSEILQEYGIVSHVMVPDFYFSPDNFNSPLNTRYKNIYLNLDKRTRKFLSIFFESPICYDDIGIIFEEARDFTVLTYADITLDMVLDNVIESNLILSSFSFYYNSQYDKFKRNYVKLQDVLANVGGLMQIVYYAFLVLITPYQNYKMNAKFANSFFSFDVEQEKELSRPTWNFKLITHKHALNSLKNKYISLKCNNPSILITDDKANKNVLENLETGMKSQKRLLSNSMNLNKEVANSPFNYSIADKACLNMNSYCAYHKLRFNSISNEDEDSKDRNLPIFNFDSSFNDPALDSSIQKKESKKTTPDQSCIIQDNKVRYQEIHIAKKASAVNKFENFFSSHLRYLAQKKKGSFNLYFSQELMEDMKAYKKKYSKANKIEDLQDGFNASFIGYIKLMICPNKMQDKAYTMSKKLITEKLDIANYLKLIHDTSKLKKILLNYYQNLSLNFQIKPNIHYEDDIVLNSSPEDMDRYKIETISYYLSLDKNEIMTSTDYIILQDLEAPLRNLILDKCPDLKFFYTKLG